MRNRLTPLPALCLSLLAALSPAGCDRDATPKAVAAKADTVGRVRVTEGPALERWIPPTVTVGPEQVDTALDQADLAAKNHQWFLDSESVLPIVLAVESNATNTPGQLQRAKSLRKRAIDALLVDGQALLPQLDSNPTALDQARTIAAVIRSAAPGEERTFAFLDEFERRQVAALLNGQALAALQRKDLGDAPDQGAQGLYRQVLRTDPNNAVAQQGLAQVEQAFIDRARFEANRRLYHLSARALRQGSQVRSDADGNVAAATKELQTHRTRYLQLLKAQGIAGLVDRGDLKLARSKLVEMIRVSQPGEPLVAELSTRIELFQHYGPYRPGQTFTDEMPSGGRGPRMVVVPHGAFIMGSTDADPQANKNEKPAHEVRFARGFAMAEHEVTVAEFGRFIAATQHRTRASRRGFSTIYSESSGNYARQSFVDWYSDFHGAKAAMNAPVMHVSVRDALAYVQWLSEKTGHEYRLPSEAEFEYALRAGSADVFPWGSGSPKSPIENLTGLRDVSVSGRRWANGFEGYGDGYWGPAPVEQFAANAFGLRDMGGNLSEWTADCVHAGFRRAPKDGKAWVNSGCRSYVTKGGSWASSPAQTRSAFRVGIDADTTNAKIGFRVVRDL